MSCSASGEPQNNQMQLTAHGSNGAPQLIWVLDGREGATVRPTTIAYAAGVALACPTLVAAEVSDKIPSVSTMWGGALLGAGIACLAGFVHPRWLWLGLPLAVLTVAPGIATVLDTYVGPAALREQGLAYGVHAWASAGAVLAGTAAGVMLHRRRRGPRSGSIKRA